MKGLIILPLFTTWLCMNAQYVGTASVTQGRAEKTIAGLFSCTGGRPTDVGTIKASDGTQWTVPAGVMFKDSIFPFASDLYNSCTGALYPNASIALSKLNGSDIVEVDKEGELITAFIFADNYFEMYINGVAVGKDKVPFTPFNSSIIRFRANQPFTVAMLLVDWEENLGLGSEANGGFAYHPGDGGMVTVFRNESGKIIGSTNKMWKAQTFYTSPIKDLSCSEEIDNARLSGKCSTSDTNNGAGFFGLHWKKPEKWFEKDFDDSSWPTAYEFSNEVVGINNKPAYTNFSEIFDDPLQDAKFIWSSNIILDNEVVVRNTIGLPSGISESSIHQSIIIQPNPGRESLSLIFGEATQKDHFLKAEIMDTNGSVLSVMEKADEYINTSSLPVGLYLVRIHFTNAILYRQWIKN